MYYSFTLKILKYPAEDKSPSKSEKTYEPHQSSGTNEEEHFYFLPHDSETEKDILERKQNARRKIPSHPNQQPDAKTNTHASDPQKENLPLVCNNTQDTDREKKRQLHDDTSYQ